MQMWQLHNDPELIGSLRELEGHVGLSVGFILGCLQEDDWSMVIKMHALLEASLSRIIVYALGDDRLSDIITRVDFGDAKKGKVKIASTLGLIEKDEARFLRWFTELRNTLVHNVSNVNFNFKEYYEALADREKDRIIKLMLYAYVERVDLPKARANLSSSLKYVTWICAAAICALVNERTSMHIEKHKERKYKEDLGEHYIEH